MIWVIFHFVSGPFAPQAETSVTFGELASGMVKSAARDLAGMDQPTPDPVPWDVDRVLKAIATVAGGLAMMLGILGFARHESKRLSLAAITLGVGEITAQFFVAAFAMVLCALVLIAFFQMIGEWSPFS